MPFDAIGNAQWQLNGLTQTNVVTGPVKAPPSCAYSLRIFKGGTSVWRLEAPGDYSHETIIAPGGRLIAAADEALGHGGETRLNAPGHVTL